MRRTLVVAGVLIIGLVGACRLFWPERWAVNPPRGTLFGSPEPATLSKFQSRVKVPEGFTIGKFAEGIRNARFLRFTPAGDLLVSSPRQGTVFLLRPDADGDGASDGVEPPIEGLKRPHGLDLRDGWLYIGETDRIVRVRFDPAARSVQGAVETVADGLPGGGNHWTRTVRFGPDGHIYVSVGSSCNICTEEDSRRATIVRYQADGSGEEIFASGLRNSVGFAEPLVGKTQHFVGGDFIHDTMLVEPTAV